MLSICLWKEWREHRATFFWLLGIALSVQILLTAVLPEFWVGPVFLHYSILGWAAIAVLLFSTALVQTEYRTEHDTFPSRLPMGERSRFYSKVILLVILVLATLSLQGLILASMLWLRGIPSVAGLLESLRLVPVLLSAGLLLMAAAWWLPRSALVHPFAILLLGIVTLPFSVSFIQRSWALPSNMEFFVLLGVLLPLLSLLVARLSSLGMKVSVTRAFCMGGGAFVCGLCGISVLGAVRIDEWDRFDPLAENAQFSSALIGKGVKLAYVNARGEGASRSYALMVDLETGAWEQVGDGRTQFLSASYHDRSGPLAWSQAGQHGIVLESRFDGSLKYRDGHNAKILETGNRRIASNHIIPHLRRSLAGVAFLRTKDNEKAWFLEGIEFGDPAHPDGMPWQAGIVPNLPLGCSGMRVWTLDDRWDYYDLNRGSVFTHPDNRGMVMNASTARSWQAPHQRYLCAITHAGWFLVEGQWNHAGAARALYLHDPDTGIEKELIKLKIGSRVLPSATFSDGRLVILESGKGRFENQIVIYDPTSGRRSSPTMKKRLVGRFNATGALLNNGYPVWTPGGRSLLIAEIWTSEGIEKHLVALDPESLEIQTILVRTPFRFRVLDCPNEKEVILLFMNEGKIQRYRWGQDGGELLFPKPTGEEATGRLAR